MSAPRRSTAPRTATGSGPIVTGFLVAALLALPAGVVLAQSPDPSASPVPSLTPDASPAAASPGTCVEPEASAPPLPPDALNVPEEMRIALFENVWTGIRDFYIDPELNGLDWDAIGDEYAPLIIQTDDAFQVYALLAEMVELLEDPYTRFLSPADLGDPAAVDPTYVGIGALVDSSAASEDSEGLRILYVFQGASARDAGIEARDRVIAVNGDPCARIADIRGPEGTEVTLTVVSPGEEPRDVVVERRRIDPLTLPEARRLGDEQEVGYLRVPGLAGQPVIDAVNEALTGFVDMDAPIESLILDVRSTNVGAPGVVVELLRPFVAGEVGAFHTRVGDEPIVIEPDPIAERYATVPIAVLVDGASEAEAEQLAAILQDQGRATIIGQQTVGETHTTNSANLPDGSILQIVSVGFRLPDGDTLEGVGVTPDIAVEEDWLDFAEEQDPFILAALDHLATAEPPATIAPTGSPGTATSATPEPGGVVVVTFPPGDAPAPTPDAAVPPEATVAPAGTPTALRTPTPMRSTDEEGGPTASESPAA
jgi:carboxyl-terminal processing protease